MQSQLRTTIVQDDQFLMVGNVTFNTAFLSQSHVTCNACINCFFMVNLRSYCVIVKALAGLQCLDKKVCKWQYFVVVSNK